MNKPRGDCIEWLGAVMANGYGLMYLANKSIGVHRLSWALFNGRMPEKNKDRCWHSENDCQGG